MNCKDFEERIPEYLAGMLDNGAHRSMEGHRDSCAECAKLLKLHEFILSALDTAEPVKAPAGLTERILAAAAAEEVPARSKFFRMWALIPAAAAFIFIVGALGRLGSLLSAFPGVRDMSENAATNWTYFFDWPLLLKAWFLGQLGQPWMQTLLEPVHITALSFSVPLYLFVLYVGMLGLLGWYILSYFHSPSTSSGYSRI